MNFNPATVLILLYYEERSQIYSYNCFPKYPEITRIKESFLGATNVSDGTVIIYQNLERETEGIYDEDCYKRLVERLQKDKVNKLQFYIVENKNTTFYQTINPNENNKNNNNQCEEISFDEFNDTSNINENTNEINNKSQSIHENLSEEGNSTSLKSGKNNNDKFGIKKSEKHIKTLFVWAKMAKSKLEKNDKRLVSEDGTKRFNVCTNVSNKNVSLVVNDVNTKRKIKSKQILIYRNSFNFSWSVEEGGEKLKNLIIHLIKNFHLIDSFHDISNF